MKNRQIRSIEFTVMSSKIIIFDTKLLKELFIKIKQKFYTVMKIMILVVVVIKM
ncbi:hypothetical protein SAKOR_01547 [Staphylococcus aureus subsp. aureus CN1]|nr:hypothetical protein SAKOR_01547 [Staphylococcus aureus subsp. aureus CN1]BAR09065.1 hypothetical protein SAJPND1_01554 [Staphylococcus aureus]BAR11789.1 hypothetical protein SAJPND4_01554 [Staphylococcus aureus]